MHLTDKLAALLAATGAPGGFRPVRPGGVVNLVLLERMGFVAKIDIGRWGITASGKAALSEREAVAK